MYDTILLPTDGSEATTDAAVHAFSHAKRYDAAIHVLSVIELASSPGTAGRDEEKLDQRRRERMATAERHPGPSAPSSTKKGYDAKT